MKRTLLAAVMLMLVGCWRTTVRNANTPVGSTPIEYDNKWHNGVVYGLAELSGPYDLSKVCPANWSQIHTETDFLAGLVSALTFQIYTPQRVTIRCAAGGR